MTWTPRDSVRSWVGVASSSDGTRLVATDNGGLIYTSSDSGATWVAHAFATDWWGVATSSDGSQIFADVSAGRIYTSGPRRSSAGLASLSYTHDSQNGVGTLTWIGSGIDTVMFSGPACLYPAPFNYGTFTGSWDGSLVNLEPGKKYSFTITVRSKDGIGESRTLEIITPTAGPSNGNDSIDLSCAKTNSTQLFTVRGTIGEIKDLIRKIVTNSSEVDALTTLINQLDTVDLNAVTNAIRLPRSVSATSTAKSLTPTVCSASWLYVVPNSKGTCTIEYTVVGKSGNSFTATKTFVF